MTEEKAKRYVSRSQAAKSAYANGHMFFKTKRDPIQRQYWTFMRLTPLAHGATKPEAFDWAKGRDWVRWVEVDWIDEGRKPGYINVLMVSCLKSEIPADELVEAERLGYEVRPQTPSMWEAESERDRKKALKVEKYENAPRLGKGKSEVKGSTKLVWEIADALEGEPTKDQVIAACVERGIHEQTALTQYYRWRKARKG